MIAPTHRLLYAFPMRTPLLVLPVICCMLAFPAAATPDIAAPLETWQQLRDSAAPNPAFQEGASFLASYSGWPDEKLIRMRTEAAALFERPDPPLMRRYCEQWPPISGRGMFACLIAQAGDPQTRRGWLHKGWIQGDFTDTEEKTILKEYGDQLTEAVHMARMERLLYDGKEKAAARMQPLMPAAWRLRYKVRMALINNDRDSKKLLAALSNEEKNDLGIVYERAKQAYANKDMGKVASLIGNIPGNAPYPEYWWPMRHTVIRQLILEGDYKNALRLLKHHGDLTGEALADSLWLKGWLSLEYAQDSPEAYRAFHMLYAQSNTPVTRARAAYWAGRAATKNGNPDIAREWWEKAAQYPTVFYGQLGYAKLHPGKPLRLPPGPSISKNQRSTFKEQDSTQALIYLANAGNAKLFDKFVQHLANNEDDAKQLSMLASLAGELGGVSREVKIAKLALRKQVALVQSGWPQLELPTGLVIEPALALAITRQESEFDPYARSSADARGLMQLLPSTAKHVAKQNDLAYTEESLEKPLENIILGTTYLGQMIRGFDGSYILGIASYNAGPGSVRKWIKEMGMPPKDLSGTLNWVESIPFSETRNYVMRVLENLQVYRTLDNPETPLALEKDVLR